MPNVTIKEYSGAELVKLALVGLGVRNLPHKAELIYRKRDPSRGQEEREIVLRTEVHDEESRPGLGEVDIVLLSPRAAQGARGGKARAKARAKAAASKVGAKRPSRRAA